MNSFWNKRIPTLLAFAFIIIGMAATSYLVQIGAIPFLHAAPEENPLNIRITNVTDTSFTLTYKTETPVIGSVSIGEDQNLGQIALDDRDQPAGNPTPYILHSITVRSLKPSTQYFYAVISGKTTYLNSGSPFTILTSPKITALSSTQTPLAGDVQLANGGIPTEALVYVTAQNGQTLSTLTKPSGLYIIPLNSMRTEDGSSYVQFNKTMTLQILATNGTDESRAVVFAQKNFSVPIITLSNNYDFTINSAPLASSSALPGGFPVFSLNTSVQAEPKIETPMQNETFTDSQPLLKGKALPNSTVQIEIHSQSAAVKTVMADQYGNWTFRPDTPLGPGQHTITVTTKDQNGILRTLQQIFTIFPSGTQVAEAATPSATPTTAPTPTPTPAPTAAPSPTLTPTPTLIPSPTLTSTPTPSPSPLVSVTVTPTPKPKIPATGNNSLIAVTLATLVTTAAGIVLFLINSGSSL